MTFDPAAVAALGAVQNLSDDKITKLTDLAQNAHYFYGDWELNLLHWFYDMHNSFLDVAMPLITKLGDGGIFWLVLSLILLIIPKTRKVGVACVIAAFFNILICNGIVKPLVMRGRPGWLMFYEEGPDWIRNMQMLVKFPNDYSFPSGHSAISFTVATAIFASLKGNKKWIGVGALVVAALVAISRLYVVVHWPTDVIVGSLVGIVCGIVGWALSKYVYNFIQKIIGKIKDKNKANKEKKANA